MEEQISRQPELVDVLKRLWTDSAVQQIYQQAHKYQVLDNAK